MLFPVQKRDDIRSSRAIETLNDIKGFLPWNFINN